MSFSYYTQTAIRMLSASAVYNGLYLNNKIQAMLPSDLVTGSVNQQQLGTLYNVPHGDQGYVINGFSAIGSSTGPSGNSTQVYYAYVDLLSHYQPLLFATENQIALEPAAAQLYCNVFNDSNGKANRLRCLNDPSSAPFVYFGLWAICNFNDYGTGDLFIYDGNYYNNTAPPQCVDVELEVLAAPS